MFSREFYIFAGPSLPPDISPEHRITVLPPVVDGDLRRLAESTSPGAHIHIIDGVFGAAQAITITEIGDTLRAGFTLSGSTSMGALRAVEAAPLGMRGFGKIFREYLHGGRTQDADVALLHDAEGHPLTIPAVGMAALRRTLAVIPHSAAARAIDHLESLHYSERSEIRVRAELQKAGVDLSRPCGPNAPQARLQSMHDVKVDDARGALKELFAWEASPLAIRTRGNDSFPTPGGFECLLRR